MRYLRMISAYLLLMVVLTVCQPAKSTLLSPEDLEPQTQPSNPLLTPEDTDMTSPIPLNENVQKIVTRVKEHLAQQLGIPVDKIAVSEVKSTIWRDRSLGCPRPAVDYIPMETPGYSIVLEAGERSYKYHTDDAKR